MDALSGISPAIFQQPQDILAAGSLPMRTAQPATKDRTRETATDFEAVFLNSMFNEMFTGIDSEGPFGGNGASGVWRSFLTEEYAKSFAKAGGIGIGDQVYRQLLAQQEANPAT